MCRILEAIENIPGDEQAALVATRLVAFSGPARGQQTISSPGYLDSTIQLSIGIEHPYDLIADIAQALNEG